MEYKLISNVWVLVSNDTIPEDVFSHLEGDEKKKAIVELKALLKPTKPSPIVVEEVK